MADSALLSEGLDLINAHRYADAVDVLRAYVAEAPLDPVGLRRLSVALVWIGEPNEGLEFVNRALELDPTSAKAHRARAYALAGVGRQRAAIDAMRTAIACDRADADASAYVFLGVLQANLPHGLSQAWENARLAEVLSDPAAPDLRASGVVRRAWLRLHRNALLATVAAGGVVAAAYPLIVHIDRSTVGLLGGDLLLLALLAVVATVIQLIARARADRPNRPMRLPPTWLRRTIETLCWLAGPVTVCALGALVHLDFAIGAILGGFAAYLGHETAARLHRRERRKGYRYSFVR